MTRPNDAAWMQRTVRLAEQGQFRARPNPRVGCSIVKAGVEIGAGWHPGAGQPHAEVYALREAGSAARGATAYINLEPCSHYGRTPPCTDALIEAGIRRVVIGHIDPNPLVAGKGVRKLQDAGIDVMTGVLEGECDSLNRGFFQRMDTGWPRVRCKIAQSLDGRTAMSNGDSQWITGEAARADVQYWRATSDAVLTGADTLLVDQARLRVRPDLLARRWPGHPWVKPPVRVLIDSRLRVPPEHPFFSESADTLVLTAEDAPAEVHEALTARGVDVVAVPRSQDGHHLDLPSVLTLLGQNEFNEVLVEAGPTLSGAFARSGLIDEWILYVAPRLLGSEGLPMVNWPLASLSEAPHLTILDQRQFGPDWRIIAAPAETPTNRGG